jgi:hypothetical protein
MRRDLGAVEGSDSERDQRWRSWTTGSNGGSTGRRLSRTAQIQGNFDFECMRNQIFRILPN